MRRRIALEWFKGLAEFEERIIPGPSGKSWDVTPRFRPRRSDSRLKVGCLGFCLVPRTKIEGCTNRTAVNTPIGSSRGEARFCGEAGSGFDVVIEELFSIGAVIV